MINTKENIYNELIAKQPSGVCFQCRHPRCHHWGVCENAPWLYIVCLTSDIMRLAVSPQAGSSALMILGGLEECVGTSWHQKTEIDIPKMDILYIAAQIRPLFGDLEVVEILSPRLWPCSELEIVISSECFTGHMLQMREVEKWKCQGSLKAAPRIKVVMGS